MPESFSVSFGVDFAQSDDRTVITLTLGTRVISTMEFRRGEIQNGHFVSRPELIRA